MDADICADKPKDYGGRTPVSVKRIARHVWQSQLSALILARATPYSKVRYAKCRPNLRTTKTKQRSRDPLGFGEGGVRGFGFQLFR